MSRFSERRAAVGTALTTALTDRGLTIHAVVPPKFVPPAGFLGPGAPYVTRGQFFGTETVRYVVAVVVPPGVNETRADELDDLLEEFLDALYAIERSDEIPGLTVGDVGQPGGMAVNGQTYLSAPIDVTCDVQRAT